jgi:copper(I)-binding protein
MMKVLRRGAGLILLLVAATGAFWLLDPGGRAHDLLLTGVTAAPIENRAGTVGVFLTIENAGPADRLVAATSPMADYVTLASSVSPRGLPIPARSSPSLAPDGAFLRLGGVTAALDDGLAIPLTLTFEHAGEVNTRARLVAPRKEGAAPGFGLFGIGDICVVGEGEPAPAISLDVTQDADGWRVRVVSQEFTFDKALVDGPHIPGTGHGHLYLNGLKLQRLYEPEARINALPPGRHEVRVTLNTNDHRAYVVDDVPVTASAFIDMR